MSMHAWLRTDRAAAQTRIASVTGDELVEFRMRRVEVSGSVRRPSSPLRAFFFFGTGWACPIRLWCLAPSADSGWGPLLLRPVLLWLSGRMGPWARGPAAHGDVAGPAGRGRRDRGRCLHGQPWEPGGLASMEGWVDDDPTEHVRIRYDSSSGAPRQAWRARRMTYDDVVAGLALRGWCRLHEPFPLGRKGFRRVRGGRRQPVGGRGWPWTATGPTWARSRVRCAAPIWSSRPVAGTPWFYQAVRRSQVFRDLGVLERETGRKSARHRLFRPV